MKSLIIIIVLISIPVFAVSQGKVSGIIVDASGEPLCYATVSELITSTNVYKNTVLSDTLGRFSIHTQEHEPTLFITSIGHKSKKILVTVGQEMEIIMEADTMLSLNEVTITAQKPQIKFAADRLIYDMSSNPLKDDNMLAALKFVPLVYANEESFSIIGKDRTEFYINGRKSNMNQDALITYLKTLPAENIKNIEIITTPGSTFRGEGNFGIINIELKENENDGLKGVITGQIWKTHYVKEMGSLDLNYQKNKLTTDFSVGITNSSDWKENDVSSVYKENGLITNTNTLTDGDYLSYYTTIRADYRLRSEEVIGIIVNARMGSGNWIEKGMTKFKTESSDQIDSMINIDYQSKSYNPEIAINGNYRLNFGSSNQYLIIDLDYLNNYNKYKSVNIMNYVDDAGEYVADNKNFKQITPHKTHLYSGKIEYGNNIGQDFNLKMGMDTYYSNTDFDDKYTTWHEGEYIPDTLRSNQFELKEWTSALFMNADKKWSSKLSASLGARLEYTHYKGIQHTTNENVNDKYFKLLPVFYVGYAPINNHKFNYDFSYRVSRPQFSNLNPFKTYTSPNSYKTGNPFLKPSTRIAHYLQYLFFNKYYLTASYSTTKDIINQIQIIKEDDFIETKPVNLGKLNEFRLAFNTTTNYMDNRASMNFNIAYNWMKVKGTSETVSLDYSIQFLDAYLYNYFLLSKKYDLSFDMGGSFSTKQRYANIEYPSTLNLNAQLKKKIRNWQLGLYCNVSSFIYDSKWTLIGRRIYDTEDLQTITYRKGETVSVGIRASYSFGNTNVKGIKQRSTSNSEVKSRVN